MKFHTTYLTFNTKRRQEIIDITEAVETCRAAGSITDGMVLVSWRMHISASVFVNDHEPGLRQDILDWLEARVAPWAPDDYRHNAGTVKTTPRRTCVPDRWPRGHRPCDGRPARSRSWQRVFYGEWDGQRPKRVDSSKRWVNKR